MKIIKKYKNAIILFTLNIYLFLLPTITNAQSDGGLTPPTGLKSVGEVINRVSTLVAPFAVLGFIGCVIYAGYTRMFALGNPDKEAKSIKIAVAAAIGFAIIALAPLFVNIFAAFIGADTKLLNT